MLVNRAETMMAPKSTLRIGYLRISGATKIEPRPDKQLAWVAISQIKHTVLLKPQLFEKLRDD